jgi:tetratricopeptide (TPR) repeat protein
MQKKHISLLISFFVLLIVDSVYAAALPRSVQTAVYETQKLMEEKSYKKAEERLKIYLSKHPDSNQVPIFFTLANIYSLQGESTKAEPFYRLVLKKDPTFSPAWQNLGSVLFDLEKYIQAGKSFEKAYETEAPRKDDGTKSNILLYHAAIAYLTAEKPALARPHLEYLTSGAVKEIKQEWLEALFKTYLDLKKSDLALQLILKLIQQDGENPKWWHFLAHLHMQKEKYEKAAEALTIRSYLKKITREETLLMADLYRMIGTPHKAAAAYENAIGTDNDCRQKKCSGYYEKLAHSYLAGHEADLALESLDKAIAIAPEARLYQLKGQIMMSSEQWQSAYIAFGRAAILDTENGRGHLLAGYCALQGESYKEARVHLTKATTFTEQSNQARQLLDHIDILTTAGSDTHLDN